jgi:DNA mismatch endonuclease (patch repair protein)
MMAGIRGRDTKPELLIRKGLHAKGVRYRLHAKELPGRPDLYLPRFNAVILVHGCFWHGHDCRYFKVPKTRPEFWLGKIDSNRSRDVRTQQALQDSGLRILVIWECAIRLALSAGCMDKLVGEAHRWLFSELKIKEINEKDVGLICSQTESVIISKV